MVISGAAFRLTCAGVSRAGASGKPNQDALAILHPAPSFAEDKGSLFVVADGVGGYHGGEIASTMACEQLVEQYYEMTGADCAENLHEAVVRLNAIVHRASREAGAHRGMCTTLVSAVVSGSVVVFAHAGDSKALLFRGSGVAYASADHGVTVPMFESRGKRVLTQSVGARATVRPTVHQFDLEDGDTIVLCSDGLSDVLSLEEIHALSTAADPMTSVAALMAQAKNAGGTDDISVIVIHVLREPEGS